MRTTLDLDRDLLDEAKRALGVDSFTEAIEVSLREAVARASHRKAWDQLMGSDLSWESVEELLDHRRRHGGRTS